MANMQEAWANANQKKEQERREKEQALRKNMSVLESKEKTVFKTNEVITSIRKTLVSRIIEYALKYNISISRATKSTALNKNSITRLLQKNKEKTAHNGFEYTLSMSLIVMASICAYYNMKPIIVSKYKDEKLVRDLQQIEKDIVKICKKNGNNLIDAISKILISQTQYIIANKVIKNGTRLTTFANDNNLSANVVFGIMGRGPVQNINSVKNRRILIRTLESVLESLGCYIKIVSIDNKSIYFDKDYTYLYDRCKISLPRGFCKNPNLSVVNDDLNLDPYYTCVVPQDEREFVPDFDDTIVKQALVETDRFEDANETDKLETEELVEALETVPLEEPVEEEIQVVPKVVSDKVEVELMIGGIKVTVPAEVIETETGKKVKLNLDLSFNM